MLVNIQDHTALLTLFVPQLDEELQKDYLARDPHWGWANILYLTLLTLFHSNIWSADEECELCVVRTSPAMGERKNTISANSKVPLFQKLGFL